MWRKSMSTVCNGSWLALEGLLSFQILLLKLKTKLKFKSVTVVIWCNVLADFLFETMSSWLFWQIARWCCFRRKLMANIWHFWLNVLKQAICSICALSQRIRRLIVFSWSCLSVVKAAAAADNRICTKYVIFACFQLFRLDVIIVSNCFDCKLHAKSKFNCVAICSEIWEITRKCRFEVQNWNCRFIWRLSIC